MIVVIVLLAIAAGLTLYFTMRNGGAEQIDFDRFVEYVENNKYTEGENGAAQYKVEGQEELQIAENYRFNDHKLQVKNGKDESGNDIWENTVVIKAVNFSEYKMYGEVEVVRNGKTNLVARYYSVGPSFYSSPVEDSVLFSWMDLGVSITYHDPNAGSIWSSILPIAGIILVCVVFWLIMRSTMGGGGKAMA